MVTYSAPSGKGAPRIDVSMTEVGAEIVILKWMPCPNMTSDAHVIAYRKADTTVEDWMYVVTQVRTPGGDSFPMNLQFKPYMLTIQINIYENILVHRSGNAAYQNIWVTILSLLVVVL